MRQPIAVLAVLLSLTGGLAACQRPAPESESRNEAGRAETRTIRNTEAIGYSGAAIADKVDAALDTTEQRAATLEAAAGQ